MFRISPETISEERKGRNFRHYIVGLIFMICLVFFALLIRSKVTEIRGKVLTDALREVDLTTGSFFFEVNECYDIPPSTDDDLTLEGRTVMQAYVDTLEFDFEAARNYNPLENYYGGGGDQFFLRIDLENGFLLVDRWGSHMRIQLEEENTDTAVGLFTYGKEEYKDIFALFGIER